MNDSAWRAHDYHLFLAGDACPSWIERIEPPANGACVVFTADAEAIRFEDHVEIRPLFPLTEERPHFIAFYNASGEHVVFHGAPTHIQSTSRHFPDVPLPDCTPGPDDIVLDCDDDSDGEEWKQ